MHDFSLGFHTYSDMYLVVLGGYVPTVFQQNGFKFQINARDHAPPHVHVVFKNRVARVTIKTRVVLSNEGFSSAELKLILKAIEKRSDDLMKQWEDFYG